jgi:hypothetical protein
MQPPARGCYAPGGQAALFQVSLRPHHGSGCNKTDHQHDTGGGLGNRNRIAIQDIQLNIIDPAAFADGEREAKITLSERFIDTAESLLREIAEPVAAKKLLSNIEIEQHRVAVAIDSQCGTGLRKRI